MPTEVYNRANHSPAMREKGSTSLTHSDEIIVKVKNGKQPISRQNGKQTNATQSQSKKFDIVLSCLLFMTVGPSLIFLNKYLMSYVEFKFPIMLASLGIIRFVILCILLTLYYINCKLLIIPHIFYARIYTVQCTRA